MLQQLLPSYAKHIEQSRGASLLPRFFGLHALRYGPQGELNFFVVMNNVNVALYKEAGGSLESLEDHSGIEMQTYDLKGSWVERTAGASASTKKDMDLTRPVVVSKEHHQCLMSQLEADTKWLEQCNIMDYSLLVTVVQPKPTTRGAQSVETRWSVAHSCCHDHQPEGAPSEPSCPTFATTSSSVQRTHLMVCVGLIDVLQIFDCYKRGELFLKSCKKWSERQGLSCIPPEPYQRRFMSRMSKVFVDTLHLQPSGSNLNFVNRDSSLQTPI